MKTATKLNRIAAAVFCMLVPLLQSEPIEKQHEFDPSEPIEIRNLGEAIEVVSAKLFEKRETQRIKVRLSRRGFVIFPKDAHLHAAFYDTEGNLLVELPWKLNASHFRRSSYSSRYRDKSVIIDSGISSSDTTNCIVQICESEHPSQQSSEKK